MYKAGGDQALARFRGMFAFVIWDDTEKHLFAARDRFGIKPLYLVANSGGVALASEITSRWDGSLGKAEGVCLDDHSYR